MPPFNSYSVKLLRITFTLNGNNAVFQGTNSNQLVVTDLRTVCDIKGSGLPAWPEATIRIYGMRQADMNSLAIVPVDGGKPQFQFNTVQIEADSGSGYVYVFSGQIFQAGPDYTDAPNVSLLVHATTGGYDQLLPAQPTSFPGTANVADIAGSIVSKMGMAFENDGVTGTLSHQYFSGSLRSQLNQLAAAANIYVSPEAAPLANQNLIVISPAGVPRQNLSPFNLSPSSGLVSYPTVIGNGFLDVRAFFNPAFRQNGAITISSSDVVIDNGLQGNSALNSLADGNWTIGPLRHILESWKPNGAWFTDMRLYPPNAAPPP